MAAGSFLTGFANAYQGQRDRAAAAAAREEDRADLAAWREQERGMRQADQAYRADELAYRRSVMGGGGSAEPMRASDPVNTTLAPHQRAFLNAISDGESGGQYNIRYSPQGGQTFDLSTGQHPQVYEAGPHGPSSAAGRYQFTWSTWRDIAGADTPFTEENQDAYAWQLAARDYRSRTGRDLDADLQSGGFNSDIMSALAPTWAAFGNEGRYDRYAATYNDSLSRYSTPAPAPAAPEPRGINLPGLMGAAAGQQGAGLTFALPNAQASPFVAALGAIAPRSIN